jgi:hypothetical protein
MSKKGRIVNPTISLNLFVALEKLEESKHAQNIECAERKTKG